MVRLTPRTELIGMIVAIARLQFTGGESLLFVRFQTPGRKLIG
jgi:hypothetical protein